MMIETNVQLPPDKLLALRVVPQPSDANLYGDVFGGWIMSQVDIAGTIPAVRRARGRVVTVAVNSFVFKQPVWVGDLLSFYAQIIKTGNTSLTVFVEVYAQRIRSPERLFMNCRERLSVDEEQRANAGLAQQSENLKRDRLRAHKRTDNEQASSELETRSVETIKVTEATLTYVATDIHRRPRPLPVFNEE